ncbi:probable very-long-chain enoyl-CoA reductase art-1 [Phlebotomus argentipes]|uniref:probable very-long-chain enoyl-CoA reductase art-1 n=1 Tax=Phlebotomus argentipes TaxID=94469 RepID=UPI0028935B42|nr:probable very-long-chain enoyl-CoA reductase art-1 [Phlebotomus argentipes]
MEVEVLFAHNSKLLTKCQLQPNSTVAEVKRQVYSARKALNVDRQAIRLADKGKALKDSETMQSLGIRDGSKLYVKDLGPQISWTTVFLAEYAGPLIVYLWIYQRPWLFYGDTRAPVHQTAHIAAACWTLHYAKRLLETIFVHRFSHATMPLRNLFKNCAYYWGFTAYVAYHVNHPLFTSPCTMQVYAGLAAFLISELGNFSIHMNLRNLRPPGTSVRKIPRPDANPLTALFNFVSCPNYTYEVLSWLSFSVLTQCLPALLFTAAGMYQMTMWALGKHRNYRKEFKDYPRQRKAILPFVL